MHVLRIQIAFSGGLLVVDGGSKVQNLIASTCGSCCSKYISKKMARPCFFQAHSDSESPSAHNSTASHGHGPERGTFCSNVASPRDTAQFRKCQTEPSKPATVLQTVEKGSTLPAWHVGKGTAHWNSKIKRNQCPG